MVVDCLPCPGSRGDTEARPVGEERQQREIGELDPALGIQGELRVNSLGSAAPPDIRSSARSFDVDARCVSEPARGFGVWISGLPHGTESPTCLQDRQRARVWKIWHCSGASGENAAAPPARSRRRKSIYIYTCKDSYLSGRSSIGPIPYLDHERGVGLFPSTWMRNLSEITEIHGNRHHKVGTYTAVPSRLPLYDAVCICTTMAVQSRYI